MKKFKTVCNTVFNTIELYLPNAIFIFLFGTYILMIAYRYIFHAQIAAVFELNIMAFVWLVLSASFGVRDGSHISFEIVYNKLSEKLKVIFRLFGDLLVLVTFFIMLPNVYDSINFLNRRLSSFLKIPYSIIFFPFIVFVVLTLIHYSVLMVKDIRSAKNLWKGKESNE